MPEPRPKSKGPKGKGKGLQKKYGPLPLWAYLLGAIIVVGYLYYRHRQAAASNAITGSLDQQSIPSGVITPTSGTSGGTDNSGGVSASPTTFPSDYLSATDFQSAISQLDSDITAAIATATLGGNGGGDGTGAGTPGPTGPAGPAGPRGPRGKTGPKPKAKIPAKKKTTAPAKKPVAKKPAAPQHTAHPSAPAKHPAPKPAPRPAPKPKPRPKILPYKGRH
jgi:hypothetical protein